MSDHTETIHITKALIEDWRARAKAGDLNDEDMKLIVAHLRQGRLTAAASSRKAKETLRAKNAPSKTGADLLADLEAQLGDL